jgi:hypothetical protein
MIHMMPMIFTDNAGPNKILGVFQPYAEVEFMQRRTTIATYSRSNERLIRMRIQHDMDLLRMMLVQKD